MSIVVIAEALFGFDASVVDIWIPVFAYPAFLGGVAFSTVLGIAGGRRRLDEMSLSRFAGWRALGGILLSGFVMTIGSSTSPYLSVVVFSVITLLRTVSAVGSLALARMAEDLISRRGSASRTST